MELSRRNFLMLVGFFSLLLTVAIVFPTVFLANNHLDQECVTVSNGKLTGSEGAPTGGDVPLDAVVSCLEKQKGRLSSTIARHLHQLGGEKEGLLVQVASLSSEREELSKKVSTLSKENDQRSQEAQALRDQRDSLLQKLSTVSDERDQLSQTVQALRGEKIQLLKKIGTSDQEKRLVSENADGKTACERSCAVQHRQCTDDESLQGFEKAFLGFNKYREGGTCPSASWMQVMSLKRMDCGPVPIRRCFTRSFAGGQEPLPYPKSLWTRPPDGAINWHGKTCNSWHCLATRTEGNCAHCFDYEWERKRPWATSVPKVLALKGGTIRTGVDIGGGTGSFAATMALYNVTIAVTGIEENDAPFLQAIASRGLLSMDHPRTARLPFFQYTLDLIHACHSVYTLDLYSFETMLYDWDRVLRPGGIIWLEEFYKPEEELPPFQEAVRRLEYKTLLWTPDYKYGQPGDRAFTAILEKPLIHE